MGLSLRRGKLQERQGTGREGTCDKWIDRVRRDREPVIIEGIE